MQTIIMDDHGRAWDARSPALRSFLHCSLPDFDFLTYLIENLGFVAVTKIAPNAARIRFRSETVSQTSIAAVLYYLADTYGNRAHYHFPPGPVRREAGPEPRADDRLHCRAGCCAQSDTFLPVHAHRPAGRNNCQHGRSPSIPLRG